MSAVTDTETNPAVPPESGEAIILRGVGGGYLLGNDNGPMGIATPRGIFRKDGISPMPGDRIQYGPTRDPDVPYRIDTILPRKNLIARPAVANLDTLFILVSARRPAPDLLLVDKLLILCGVHGIEPVVCVTKNDLGARAAARIASVYLDAGIDTYVFGTDDQANLEVLRGRIRGKTVGFAGPSGVGKSTLLNKIAGRSLMETGTVSHRIQRGRHTTRHVELFPFAGGYLADTPGFTSLDLWDAGVTGPDVVNGYPEIEKLEGRCRFQGCRHVSEPGCAVAESDAVHPDRLERYRYFRIELDSVDPYSKRRPPGSGVS